jgi:hypothetical protein
LSGLLTNGPAPHLFFKIRGGLSIEAHKSGFTDPIVWKFPVVGGRIACPNIVDAISMHHVVPDDGFA